MRNTKHARKNENDTYIFPKKSQKYSLIIITVGNISL